MLITRWINYIRLPSYRRIHPQGGWVSGQSEQRQRCWPPHLDSLLLQLWCKNEHGSHPAMSIHSLCFKMSDFELNDLNLFHLQHCLSSLFFTAELYCFVLSSWMSVKSICVPNTCAISPRKTRSCPPVFSEYVLPWTASSPLTPTEILLIFKGHFKSHSPCSFPNYLNVIFLSCLWFAQVCCVAFQCVYPLLSFLVQIFYSLC